MKKAFLAAVVVSLSAHAVAPRLVAQVTPSSDMGFGAYLALETQRLVRCAQRARGAPSH